MDWKRSEKIVNERLEKIWKDCQWKIGNDPIWIGSDLFFGRRSESRLDPIFWDSAIHWVNFGQAGV